MIKSMLYIVLGLVLVVVVVVKIWGDKPISDQCTTEYSIQEVEIKTLNESVFLKQATWGVSSDAKVTAISSSREENIDYESENDFIYRTGATLFFKVKGGTLHVLAMELAIKPVLFKSEVVIHQERIENSEFIQLFKSYNERGYSKFPKQTLRFYPKIKGNVILRPKDVCGKFLHQAA